MSYKEGTYDTQSCCGVCGCVIKMEVSRVFVDHHRPAIIGPGSASQWSTRVKYYCSSCGLCYKFVPDHCIPEEAKQVPELEKRKEALKAALETIRPKIQKGKVRGGKKK